MEKVDIDGYVIVPNTLRGFLGIHRETRTACVRETQDQCLEDIVSLTESYLASGLSYSEIEKETSFKTISWSKRRGCLLEAKYGEAKPHIELQNEPTLGTKAAREVCLTKIAQEIIKKTGGP